MSCANMCTVCLSVYTPKEAAGMDGNASCLFQGKMYAPNSGSISNGAQSLASILFTFLSWRNCCIFSSYSCLLPGIWQGLYVVTFSSSTAIIRSKMLVVCTNRRRSVLMQKHVNAPFVLQCFAGYWCTPFSFHLGPSGAMRRCGSARQNPLSRSAVQVVHSTGPGTPACIIIYGTLPSPASKPSAERLIPAATAIDA